MLSKVDPASELANHYEIHTMDALLLQRREVLEGVVNLDRTNVGIKVELLTKS